MGALVINRHYDATPWNMGFGALDETLHPHARYLLWDESKQRFTLVPMNVYRQARPRAKLCFGVLELFAQRAELTYCTHLGESVPRVESRQVISPPVILERANGSTIHTAVESASDELSIPGIQRYLRDKRCVIINDCPDNASSNKRRQAMVADELADDVGALFAPSGAPGCRQACRNG